MFKTFKSGWLVFKLSYEANGFYTIFSLISKLYESTLYPFIQVFLLARLLDILGRNHFLTISDLTYLIIAFIIASLIKIVFTTFLDNKTTYLDYQFESYIDLIISKKLTQLDPATLENPKFQALLAQIEGIKGTMQSQLIRFVSLVNFIFQFITASVVISVTYPISIPLLFIATIPIFIVAKKSREKTWPYFVEKRSNLNRVTQYIKNLLSQNMAKSFL